MFNRDQFIEACKAAVAANDSHMAVRELVAEAVADPAGILKELGEPEYAGVETLYKSDTLTILDLRWGPRMDLPPHNHNMWAVIGIYGGREVNNFYKRDGSHVVKQNSKEFEAGHTAPLGKDVIHGVINPLDKITAALHVYGGDFFETPRSEWDPDTASEGPLDAAATVAKFEEANQRLRQSLAS